MRRQISQVTPNIAEYVEGGGLASVSIRIAELTQKLTPNEGLLLRDNRLLRSPPLPDGRIAWRTPVERTGKQVTDSYRGPEHAHAASIQDMRKSYWAS